MNDDSLFHGFYWSRKEGPSLVSSDAQYATLWLFPTGRFRYIGCRPGYSWFRLEEHGMRRTVNCIARGTAEGGQMGSPTIIPTETIAL